MYKKTTKRHYHDNIEYRDILTCDNCHQLFIISPIHSHYIRHLPEVLDTLVHGLEGIASVGSQQLWVNVDEGDILGDVKANKRQNPLFCQRGKDPGQNLSMPLSDQR